MRPCQNVQTPFGVGSYCGKRSKDGVLVFWTDNGILYLQPSVMPDVDDEDDEETSSTGDTLYLCQEMTCLLGVGWFWFKRKDGLLVFVMDEPIRFICFHPDYIQNSPGVQLESHFGSQTQF